MELVTQAVNAQTKEVLPVATVRLGKYNKAYTLRIIVFQKMTEVSTTA